MTRGEGIRMLGPLEPVVHLGSTGRLLGTVVDEVLLGCFVEVVVT